MTATATIRIPVPTRDAFAELARDQGMATSAYLVALAARERRAAVIEAERRATAIDAHDPAAAAEFAVWAETVSDGIE
jgi:hypothetical protein